MTLRLLATAALLAVPAAPAPAAVVYGDQTRWVEAETSHRPDHPELAERVVATDFGPFAGDAQSYLFDPEDLDRALARVTQNSRLEGAGLFASGMLDVRAGGEFGRGRSLFDVVFEVTGPPIPYTLRYDLESTHASPVRGYPFRADVLLEPVNTGGGPSAPVFGPTSVNFGDPERDPMSWSETRSGTLAPGHYRLTFDVRAFSVSYDEDYSANYAFSLVLPEPSAPGLAVFGGASVLLRRRRGRRPPAPSAPEGGAASPAKDDLFIVT